ncbi:MAG: peptide chain release factor N(5)-glutamine methyltransferase [bacterium]
MTEESRLDAEHLIAHAFKISRTEVITRHQKLIETIARRLDDEPLAYIIGSQPFLGLDFIVNKNVLIPRPETELLVETVLRFTTHDSRLTIADVGTGSGCIAVSLASALPNAKLFAIDSVKEALEIAKINAAKHKVSKQIKFLQGDLLTPLQEKVDIIVSNPPYVPTEEINNDWEPRGALDGGKDGLDHIRRLIKEAPNYLKPNGKLFFEFGFGQTDKIRELTKNKGTIIKDYANIPRIIYL